MSAAASRLCIPFARPSLSPGLPSNTHGPALLRGVIGPSPFGPSGAVERSASVGALPAPEAGLRMGNGSEMACVMLPSVCGSSEAERFTVVMSIGSPASGSEWSSLDGGVLMTGAAAFASASGAAAGPSTGASTSPHPSAGSSTSASRSAPARQFGQMNIGYCGEVNRDRTHLKCHVCEHGATNNDWQG